MRNSPIIPATAAGVAVFLTKFAAQAASTVEGVSSGTDWPQLLEKAGTVGVLIWMVVWFQRRLEAKDAMVQDMTTNLIKAVDKLADAQNEVARSISKLNERQ